MPDSRVKNEQTLISLINHLGRHYRRVVNKILAAHGLSDSQALPVMFIARLGGGVRQGVLAEHLGVEGPSLVRQLDQLETARLVERRDDPNDRRAKTLHLTEAGSRLAGLIESLLGARRGALLASVSDADLVTTLRVLTDFEQAVRQAQDGAVPPGAKPGRGGSDAEA